MEQTPFGWAYLGAGIIANQTAGQIVPTGRHKLVAVYNRSRQKAEELAAKYGATVYDTPEEAIAAPGVDGVYIAVIHPLHTDYMRRCAELGKPVLCEKPLGMQAEESEAALAFAREKGVYAAEAMWTWFNATAKQVKQWVTSGEIGRVQSIKCCYAMPVVKFYKAPRLLEKDLGGGALLDVGIYPIAYCWHLLGKPEAITCTGKVENGVDLGELVTLRYPDGAACELDISLVEFHGMEKATIVGTEGTITVPMFHGATKAVLKNTRGKTVFRDTVGKNELYIPQFDTVAREIRAGRLESEAIPHASTVQIAQIMDECLHQLGL